VTRGGHKFPLVIYQHILNRWWTPMFAIGFVMFALAYEQYTHPIYKFIAWRWQLFAGIGVLAILIGIFFFVIKQFAYLQAFPGHIKLVTPFMRFNISYKRIHKTTTAEMRQLFPPKSMSGWVRNEIFQPLASQTAIVLELKSYPISPTILRLFLSRFFFRDKMPHLVILVKDWMRLSSEIDSFRTGVNPNSKPSQKRRNNSILSRLPRK